LPASKGQFAGVESMKVSKERQAATDAMMMALHRRTALRMHGISERAEEEYTQLLTNADYVEARLALHDLMKDLVFVLADLAKEHKEHEKEEKALDA
jgi:hypothetical protein